MLRNIGLKKQVAWHRHRKDQYRRLQTTTDQ